MFEKINNARYGKTMMKRLKSTKKEKELCKYLVHKVYKQLWEKHPKLKKVDTNYFHFIIADLIKKLKLPVVVCWYKHGLYVPEVDNALLDMGLMNISNHQMLSNTEKMGEYMFECDCHTSKKE